MNSFARLFMAPGMDHCGGGSGTSAFELMTALANRTEKGVPPNGTNAENTVIALRAANAAAGLEARTQPLCPYPQAARYKDTGDVNAASSRASIRSDPIFS